MLETLIPAFRGRARLGRDDRNARPVASAHADFFRCHGGTLPRTQCKETRTRFSFKAYGELLDAKRAPIMTTFRAALAWVARRRRTGARSPHLPRSLHATGFAGITSSKAAGWADRVQNDVLFGLRRRLRAHVFDAARSRLLQRRTSRRPAGLYVRAPRRGRRANLATTSSAGWLLVKLANVDRRSRTNLHRPARCQLEESLRGHTAHWEDERMTAVRHSRTSERVEARSGTHASQHDPC
jgi:hypothetical protein